MVFLYFVQIVAVLAVCGWLAHCRISLGRGNGQSWASIIARLRPAWGGHESSNHYLWKEGLTVCPDDLWSNIGGARGLWTIFKNAGILLEMVGFAERNCNAIDPIVLQRLRSDAFQIRLAALTTLIQSAVAVSGETIHINAFRVVSIYTGMAVRMVQFIEQNEKTAMPQFIAAM